MANVGRHSQMKELSLPLLLTFVEECDLSDAEDQQHVGGHQQPQPLPVHRHRSFECSAEPRRKSRPRRDVIEIAALRAQVKALSLELDKVKTVRQSSREVLLIGPSHWQLEAQSQSRRRTAAQQENERLRAQLQAKVLIAKRLANVFKRNSPSQVQRMLQRFEREAKLRTERAEDDLDQDLEQAYHQTDTVMAEAQIHRLPPTFFDAQMRRNAATGLSIEFRRCLQVFRDRATTSDAYWQFIPHQRFSERFVFDHTATILADSMHSVFLFRCKYGATQTQFSGRYQLKRFTSQERVVIVWKTLLYSSPRHSSPQLQLHGRGWVVIQSADATDESVTTSIKTFARYHPESDGEDAFTPEQAQHNVDLRALIEFVTCAMEGYGAFPTHTALLM